MTLVFLDTETTGLELHHDIWEIAWAVGDGGIHSFIVPHSIANADPKALELNGYWARHRAHLENPEADLVLRGYLEGATIVGANPAFDATRLQLRWGVQPWHYRLIDISSMAYGLGFEREDGKPMGLFDIANVLSDDYALAPPQPDHTAAGDVATLRSVYYGLRLIRSGVVERVAGSVPKIQEEAR